MSETELSPDELTPHPKNAEMYGESNVSEEFIERVRDNGIDPGAKVTDDSHFADGTVIISGHRRVAAAREIGMSVPIREYATYESPAEELNDLVTSNDYRNKSFSQQMGEADAIREIEERAAKERMSRGGEGKENLPDPDSGQSRDEIADRIGIGSGRNYQKARRVWDAAKDNHAVAQDLVTEIDTGETSIHGAYTTLNQIEEFSTNERLQDTLDELVEEGELSSDDIRRLKTGNHPSVVGWLSEQGIIPFTLEDRAEEIAHCLPERLEYATIPEEKIRTDICEKYGSLDDELFGLFVQRLQRWGESYTRYKVIPDENGEFQLLDMGHHAHCKAAKVVFDELQVDIRCADGSDTESRHSVAFGYTRWENQWKRSHTHEEIDQMMDKIDEEFGEREETEIERRIYKRLNPPEETDW